jgi:hypothetical protein
VENELVLATGEESVTTNEIVTIVALVVGPVLAVFVTRYLDDQRMYKSRRMDVFRTLMRTRRSVLSPDHIGALNLVEIEYANDQLVLAAWKKLFEHFGTPQTRRENENIDGLTDNNEINKRNETFGNRLFQERQSQLAKLLHAMAKALGFKIEQLEIFEGGYTPQFWVDLETEQAIIRKFVVELSRAKTMVPIGVIDFRTAAQLEADQREAAEIKKPADRA